MLRGFCSGWSPRSQQDVRIGDADRVVVLSERHPAFKIKDTGISPLFTPYLDRTVYRILSLDNDAHCFRVRQETNDRGRTQSIYLDPNKQKAVHSALMVEGDWQILPGQWSTDPRSFDLKALQALRNRHTRVICNHNLARNTKTGLTTSDDHTTAMQWLTTTL